MTTVAEATGVEPFSLKHAPSLIERIWPAQKISFEAQKERKANLGQTLTALGSYWKGRKPLVLVRACVLGALLPATDDPAEDLGVFEALMRIDDESFAYRDNTTKPSEYARLAIDNLSWGGDDLRAYFTIKGVKASEDWPEDEAFLEAAVVGKLQWRKDISLEDKAALITRAGSFIPYAERVRKSLRPEELGPEALEPVWDRVNRHLGTFATNLGELVQQLGIMRFGHRPKVADTFSGGGSIPFEAARMGCDVLASDLNPIACMLTWGALNVIGGDAEDRAQLDQEQCSAIAEVDAIITDLQIEHNEVGDRAKAYLYCVEARCPSSGWMVPVLPSRIISKSRNVIARLKPDYEKQNYKIEIATGVSDRELDAAAVGTLQDGYVVHTVDGVEHRTSIKSIRREQKEVGSASKNGLRLWDSQDFTSKRDDIFQERLYCIHWYKSETLNSSRPETYFAAPDESDLAREARVHEYVARNLPDWQASGLAPDMPIEPGYNTNQPIRERGWTHWHHLFTARQILLHATYAKYRSPLLAFGNMNALDWNAAITPWHTGWEKFEHVFYNQALNTFWNYGTRASVFDRNARFPTYKSYPLSGVKTAVECRPANEVKTESDIYITDPPYADAVNYHEITEFFIAWLRKEPPRPFDSWVWDSRRPLAIKGEGDDFRREMVAAYKAMAEHMPVNGVQIVMFTHQSGSVWADMAQIFWGARLQVQAAWYIATETSTELKKGGYVQGTVILVLRKRAGDEAGYEDEIAQEVRSEVARQIDTLVGLNQSLKGAGRIENLFEDADLQMAGYAAALRVLTGYTRIDGRDMTAEALRPRRKGEKGFVDRIIEFAVQVANEHMVPDGITPRLWQQLTGTERFYLKMLQLEAAGLKKLDNYQNFARAFRVPDYSGLMGDSRPNAARLARSDDLKHRAGFDIEDFGQGAIRAVLYGAYQLSKDADVDVVLEQIRGMVENYYRRREDLIEIAEYLALQRGRDDEREGRHATVLANLIRNERLG